MASGIGFALSQSITSDGEVKIAAQKLEDGRIEFALEQDGELIKPAVRYFPAAAQVGRWLKSSSISVDVATSRSPKAVRPSRNEDDSCLAVPDGDGNIWSSVNDQGATVYHSAEFALFLSGTLLARTQHRMQRGASSEPTQRMQNWLTQCASYHGYDFREERAYETGADDWKVIQSETETPSAAADAQAQVESEVGYQPYTSVGSEFVGAFWQSVRRDEFTDELITSIAVDASSGTWSSYDDPPAMWFSCLSGDLEMWFSELPLSDIGSTYEDEYTVTYRASNLPANLGVWAAGDYTAIAPQDVTDLWVSIAGTYFNLRFIGYSDSVTARFETSGIVSLPAWGNIANCGDY